MSCRAPGRVCERPSSELKPGEAPALVGDGDDAREQRCRQAGAADVVPVAPAGRGGRVVDVDARVRVGIERDVGHGADRRAGDRRLIGRLGLDLAIAATAVGPGRLADVVANRVDVQRRAADGDDVRRGGQVLRSGAPRRVAGRGEEGDAAVAGGGSEGAIEGGLIRELAASKAHGDGNHAGLLACVIDGRHQVGKAAAPGLDHQGIFAPEGEGVRSPTLLDSSTDQPLLDWEV